jgi:hypothetical protein
VSPLRCSFRGLVGAAIPVAVACVFALSVFSGFLASEHVEATARVLTAWGFGDPEPGGGVARVASSVALGVNAATAVLLLFGPDRAGGRFWAMGVLSIYALALASVGMSQGWEVHCGCFTGVLESAVVQGFSATWS